MKLYTNPDIKKNKILFPKVTNYNNKMRIKMKISFFQDIVLYLHLGKCTESSEAQMLRLFNHLLLFFCLPL